MYPFRVLFSHSGDGYRRAVKVREVIQRRLRHDQEGMEDFAAGGADEAGLERLGIEDWLVDPQLSAGSGGTQRVEGALDVAEAASDLSALLADLGGAEIGPFERRLRRCSSNRRARAASSSSR